MPSASAAVVTPGAPLSAPTATITAAAPAPARSDPRPTRPPPAAPPPAAAAATTPCRPCVDGSGRRAEHHRRVGQHLRRRPPAGRVLRRHLQHLHPVPRGQPIRRRLPRLDRHPDLHLPGADRAAPGQHRPLQQHVRQQIHRRRLAHHAVDVPSRHRGHRPGHRHRRQIRARHHVTGRHLPGHHQHRRLRPRPADTGTCPARPTRRSARSPTPPGPGGVAGSAASAQTGGHPSPARCRCPSIVAAGAAVPTVIPTPLAASTSPAGVHHLHIQHLQRPRRLRRHPVERPRRRRHCPSRSRPNGSSPSP